MSLYQKYLLPRIINFTCGLEPTMKQREKVVPLAEGRVLEIGIGSGLNLPFYAPGKVRHLWGLEPSRDMWALASAKLDQTGFPVEFLEAGAEAIPLEDGSADTILITYTLCTIPDPRLALEEMRRVLKPDGRLVFCEHGRAPDERVSRWQDRLNPVWRRFGGGCNLNRPIATLIQQAGFDTTGMESLYIPGWRPASFNYWGTAKPC